MELQTSLEPREYDSSGKADALSKLAAVQCKALTDGVLVEELNERSVDVAEVNMVVEEEGRTWMTPIKEYLEKETLSDDPPKARTIRGKINNYVIVDGVLYQKSYLGLLLHCIGLLPEAPGKLKFRIPATIITDNGTQLVNELFKSWAEGLELKVISISVCHPKKMGW
ncbi:reverse transcriptase domain-containing protein [Tanacetum coccineum]